MAAATTKEQIEALCGMIAKEKNLMSSHQADALLYGMSKMSILGAPVLSPPNLPPYQPGGLAQAVHRPTRDDRFTPSNMGQMICSRMGWLSVPGSQHTVPFESMSCVRIKGDRAVTFIVHEGVPLMIEDDLALFPSDALVTQLRLLLG